MTQLPIQYSTKDLDECPASNLVGALSVAFQTLGCKVNRYETDAVKEAFLQAGFVVRNESDPVDVFVINTCTVTSEADRKSRQMIRRAQRQHPGSLVVAMGCQVEMSTQASGADIAMGTRCRKSLVDRVLQNLGRSTATTHAEEDSASFVHSADVFEELGPVVSQEETRAYIKIQDGCDSFCSYCIIPYARGRIRSRSREDIVREAKALAENGFLEVVLTGIHICSYGRDRGEGIEALTDVIRDISEIQGIRRIRLGSLEPTALSETFLDKIRTVKTLCPHFHVSLQSGSDTVLRRMNRKYDTGYFREGIRILRSFFPEASITTDIIVGFPGEDTLEHAQSLAFCEEIGFAKIHVFPYSERPGTRAATMTPKVDKDEKSRRSSEFLALSDRMAIDFHQRMIGKRYEVLLEGADPDGYSSGYAENYVRVICTDNESVSPNTLVAVIVDKATPEGVIGHVEK